MSRSNIRILGDTPPKATIYLRQSNYREESISLELQEIACRDYCDRMGYVVQAVEADPGISGRTWKRPAVQRVMQALDDGQTDVIVLWRWSRLSRSRKDWALAIDRADLAGGRIESATEPLDTATASGRFARGLMTEYAAFQSEQIGEQWEEVRRRRLNLGLPASGRLPYGWRWKDGGIEQHPDQAPVVVEMFRRYLVGDGSAAIARWLNGQGIPGPNGNAWTRVRPFTVMDSPIHVGLIPYRGNTYPGAHAPLIDMRTWETYRDERAARSSVDSRPRDYHHLLSSLVWCACGARMHGKGSVTAGVLYSGYICSASSATDHPERAYISARLLDPAVVGWLEELEPVLEDAAVGVGAASTLQRERIAREMADIEDELAQIVRMAARDKDDPALARAFERARTLAETDLARLAAEQRKIDRIERAALDPDTLASIRTNWKHSPISDKNASLRRLIERIDVLPGGQAIRITTPWKHSSTRNL